MSKVVKTVIPSQYLDDRTIFHINPCGQFVMGGPQVNIYLYIYYSMYGIYNIIYEHSIFSNLKFINIIIFYFIYNFLIF